MVKRSKQNALRSRAMRRGIGLSLWLWAGCAAAARGGAVDTTAPAAADELLMFQDLPVVVSAARQAQPINLSSESISIITADDIHYGARTTLPEILQFTPGVDVTRIDRNDYAVGIYGLAGSLVDRTLTLIDGRDAGTASTGEADFMALPIFLEDIERIEVVHGPGGAAWGANALNGVINIISKPLDQTTGFLATSTVDEFGDTYSQLRFGAVTGKWAWRVSGGYENLQSSDDVFHGNEEADAAAGIGPLLSAGTVNGGDSASNVRFSSEASYELSAETKLTFGVANSAERRGSYEFLGTKPDGYTYLDLFRGFARVDVDPGGGSSGYVQLYSNCENQDNPSLGNNQTEETNLETQWDFATDKNNKLTTGANIRDLYTNFPMNRSSDVDGGSFSDYTGGLFVIDRWQAAPKLALEGQLRGDVYSETGCDWSGRASALYAVDEEQHHILRVSVARAFRDPLAGVLGFEGSTLPLPSPPFPAGQFGVNIEANPDLRNEHVNSVEAGYDGQFGHGVEFRAEPFYQQYQGLIGATGVADPAGLGRPFTQLQNLAGGEAYGLNTELSWARKDVTVSAWYTLDQFIPDDPGQDTRSFRPAEHMAGLNARWFVGDGITLSGNYRFTDQVRTGSRGFAFPLYSAPASHQVDLTATKSFLDDRFEASVGVADLFNQTRSAVAEEGRFTAHETPGRTVFARLQWKW